MCADEGSQSKQVSDGCLKSPYLASLWLHFHEQISVEFNWQMCIVS
jgi:hypothetical protein